MCARQFEVTASIKGRGPLENHRDNAPENWRESGNRTVWDIEKWMQITSTTTMATRGSTVRVSGIIELADVVVPA